jgi:hypothetical protein
MELTMTYTSPGHVTPGPTSNSVGPRAARRFWTRKPVIVIAALLVLAVGYGVGASAGTSTKQSLSQARSQLSTLYRKLSAADSDIAAERTKVDTAQTQAKDADASAMAKYAVQEAALASKEKTLRQDEHAVDAMEGKLQASAISADGVYVVGQDIKGGVWHTPGDGGQDDDACYYATLNSTNTSDISDNNNFDGPETVDLNGIDAFQISGPCTWYRTGS